MMVSIKTARLIGMNTDIQDYALPPDVFTLVKNGRADGASLVRGPVFRDLTMTSVTADGRGMFATQYVGAAPHIFVFYDTAAKVYRGADTDTITRSSGGAYTGTYAYPWSITRINDVVVATNGRDLPQYVALSNAASHPVLANLTNWNTDHLAKGIFAFKNKLVTFGVSKTSVLYERLIKWSHTTASGVPSSWDESDPTLDAGEVVLDGEGGAITAAAPMEDAYFLYGKNDVTAMRFIGGNAIFGFYSAIPNVGALNLNCVLPLSRTQHVVVSPDYDMHLVTPAGAESIMHSRIRKYIKTQVTGYSVYTARLVHNKDAFEVWFLFSTDALGDPTNNIAAVWDYKENSWYVIDVPEISAACYGPVNVLQVENRAVFLSDTAPKMAVISSKDDGVVADTVRSSVTFRIERTGLSVKGAAQDGSPVVDFDTVAMFQEFRPRFVGTSGQTVAISFGARMSASETVSFGSPTNFTIGTSIFLPIFLTGRLLDIRMDYASTSLGLSLEGYDLDVAPLARH